MVPLLLLRCISWQAHLFKGGLTWSRLSQVMFDSLMSKSRSKPKLRDKQEIMCSVSLTPCDRMVISRPSHSIFLIQIKKKKPPADHYLDHKRAQLQWPVVRGKMSSSYQLTPSLAFTSALYRLVSAFVKWLPQFYGFITLCVCLLTCDSVQRCIHPKITVYSS